MPIRPVSTTMNTSLRYSQEGMGRAQKRLEHAAKGIAAGEVSSSRMVDLIVSEKMYKANASVTRTYDEMVGSLLDVAR